MSSPVDWKPSPYARTLFALALVALGAAVAFQRPALLALSAPCVWTLVTTARGREPSTLSVLATATVLPAEEEVDLPVELSLVVDCPVAWVSARLAAPASFEGVIAATGRDITRLVLDGSVRPTRWGRLPLGPLRVDLLSRGGLLASRTDVGLTMTALVIPRGLPVLRASAPPRLPNRLGEHTTRAPGHGVEPMAVRAFSPGDPVRRINWRVSSRRQDLHVTLDAAERAVDLVLVVDALSDVAGPTSRSLDLAVRTATGIANRWLRERDRVGLLVLGGRVTWLTPSGGGTHVRRIAEELLWAWRPPGTIDPDVRLVPRSVLPAGAVVVFLTPLLEVPSITAVAALRERSSRVIVVDVIGDALPSVDRKDRLAPLALRLWRLDRMAMLSRLSRQGTPVVNPDDGDLYRLIALALRTVR